jgi:hypothetical protein
MTDPEETDEGAGEAIEDLDAPAAAQEDVAGGVGCGDPSMICVGHTCWDTVTKCTGPTTTVVTKEV